MAFQAVCLIGKAGPGDKVFVDRTGDRLGVQPKAARCQHMQASHGAQGRTTELEAKGW